MIRGADFEVEAWGGRSWELCWWAGRCMSRAMVSDGGAALGEIKVGFYTRYIRE